MALDVARHLLGQPHPKWRTTGSCSSLGLSERKLSKSLGQSHELLCLMPSTCNCPSHSCCPHLLWYILNGNEWASLPWTLWHTQWENHSSPCLHGTQGHVPPWTLPLEPRSSALPKGKGLGWSCLFTTCHPHPPTLPFEFIDLNHLPGPSRTILEMEGRKEERGREKRKR